MSGTTTMIGSIQGNYIALTIDDDNRLFGALQAYWGMSENTQLKGRSISVLYPDINRGTPFFGQLFQKGYIYATA